MNEKLKWILILTLPIWIWHGLLITSGVLNVSAYIEGLWMGYYYAFYNPIIGVFWISLIAYLMIRDLLLEKREDVNG